MHCFFFEIFREVRSRQKNLPQQEWLFIETEVAQEAAQGEVVEKVSEGIREVVLEGAFEVQVPEEAQDAEVEDSEVVEANQFLTVPD